MRVLAANIDVAHELLPCDGVYATRLLRGDERFPSVTSIGSQPTFRANAAGPRFG